MTKRWFKSLVLGYKYKQKGQSLMASNPVPVYSKNLYMDGRKLNFIDYNKTYMKKDKFFKITKEQLDFLHKYAARVTNEYYTYYHLTQIFAVSDNNPEEMHITKSFDELHPTVLKIFRNMGVFNKEEVKQDSNFSLEKLYESQEKIHNLLLEQVANKIASEKQPESESEAWDKLKNKNIYNFRTTPFSEGFTSTQVRLNKDMQSQEITKQYCLDIASKLPATCLQELFDNANKIKEYLESK